MAVVDPCLCSMAYLGAGDRIHQGRFIYYRSPSIPLGNRLSNFQFEESLEDYPSLCCRQALSPRRKKQSSLTTRLDPRKAGTL